MYGVLWDSLQDFSLISVSSTTGGECTNTYHKGLRSCHAETATHSVHMRLGIFLHPGATEPAIRSYYEFEGFIPVPVYQSGYRWLPCRSLCNSLSIRHRAQTITDPLPLML